MDEDLGFTQAPIVNNVRACDSFEIENRGDVFNNFRKFHGDGCFRLKFERNFTSLIKVGPFGGVEYWSYGVVECWKPAFAGKLPSSLSELRRTSRRGVPSFAGKLRRGVPSFAGKLRRGVPSFAGKLRRGVLEWWSYGVGRYGALGADRAWVGSRTHAGIDQYLF